MANFLIAHAITSGHEQGYVLNLGDGAGETYMGITRVNYPTWPGWKIIDTYKRKGPIKRYTVFANRQLNQYVEQFYKQNFWDSLIKGDAIASQQQANFVYDFAVNAQYNAVKTTNAALKKFKPAIKTETTAITPDALKVMNADPERTYSEIFRGREQYYRTLARNSKYKPFLREWLNRMYSFPTYIRYNREAANSQIDYTALIKTATSVLTALQ